MKKILLFTACFVGCIVAHAQTQVPAFPGAEGFGRFATGGRTGTVYHVTTLEDNSQQGSFRYACERSGFRTVVFDVSGTIHLKRALAIKGDITIAGQTAPGDGICVADYPVTLNGNNVIIRYMRFRLGNKYVANHEGDGFGSMDHNNIIIDHCSVSWSIDECLSVYGGQNLTVQWCIASQSLKNAGHSKGAHGYGGNWGGYKASYHHNLVVHNESRTPRLGPRPGTQQHEHMDMRNNVIYNWAGEGCYGGEGMNVNMVNNYYKPGPATMAKVSSLQSDLIGKRIAKIGIRTTAYTKHDTSNPNEWDVMWHKWGTFYVDGNYNSQYNDVTADNWTYGIYNQISNDASVDYTFTDQVKQDMRLSQPLNYETVTTHSAQTAYERVLAYAGASLHRDALDNIIVTDTRNGTATMTGNGNLSGIINTQDDAVSYITGTDGPWPTLVGQPMLTDTDGDGMPDTWEDSHGLNKNNAADGKTITSSGYTHLEIYLNALVEDITTAQNADGIVMSGQEIFVTSGIESLTPTPSPKGDGTSFYSLTGQKVDRNYKGLMIQNGRKVVIK